MELQQLVLPGSGYIIEWRSDGKWRHLSHEQNLDETQGIHVPTLEDWADSTGEGSHEGVTTGRGPDDLWVVLFGESDPGGMPSITLSDPTIEVYQVGGVWACEWEASRGPMTITDSQGQTTIDFSKPTVDLSRTRRQE